MSRAAQIHREIAALHVELAELASVEPDREEEHATPPPPKPRKRARVHPPPLDGAIVPTEIERARARRMLRARGI
jgi:hypothetical protein